MRLYNTYFLCKNLVETCSSLKFKETSASRGFFIEDWNEYRNALLALREIPLFKIEADDIIKTIPAYVREDIKPEISSDKRNALANKNARLLTRMNTIIDLYESMELGEVKNGIDVKIPKCGI